MNDSKLKELTWEIHQKAERQAFARRLISGKITELEYMTYLYNQAYVYNVLEFFASDMFPELHDIFRYENIMKDLEALGYQNHDLPLMPSVHDYTDYVFQVGQESDRDAIMANIYVRHMGDMYGGSMIAKKVPGPGFFYIFPKKAECIQMVRDRISGNMAYHAGICFQHAINLFMDLKNEFNLDTTY